MPKMKPNKAMKSRFKVTATGKLMRHKQGKRHILTKKSGTQKRRLSQEVSCPKTQTKKYVRMMGMCK